MKTTVALLAMLCLPLAPLTYCAPASATPSASPGAKPSVDISVPKDARAEWKIAFAVLSTERLSPQNSYLAFSIPLLLKDQLGDLPSHALSEAERTLQRERLIERELRTASQGVASARKARDEAYFEGTLAATGSGAEARLAVALQRRDFVASLDPGAIEIADRKPILFKEGTAAGNLLVSPLYAIQQFCEQQDLDLLVGGSISEIQEYLLIDIWAYDSLRGDVVFSYREVALQEELYPYLGEAGRELTGVLLGEEWAALDIQTMPASSTVRIDGTVARTGLSRSLYLTPGSKEILVEAPGYIESAETLDLLPSHETSLRVELEKEPRVPLVLSSDPPGADVYLSSLWMGKTPLSVDRPAKRARALVSLNGYYDNLFSIGAVSPDSLSLVLREDLVSLDDVQEKARESFYNAFGWFALSLPVPLFCYAFAGDFATQISLLQYRGLGGEAQKARTIGNVFYYSYLAGVAASASLFTYMIYTLVNYVSAADRTAG